MNAITLKPKRKRITPGDMTFRVFNHIFMVLLSITTLYPFFFLISSSLSGLDQTLGGFSLLPRQFTWDNYSMVLHNPLIASGYLVTIMRTVLGTFLSLVFTFAIAWPLAKKNFPHRDFWTGLIVFTMFFSGGMIPSYLLVRQLGMIDTIWSLVLPELISAFNFVIVRNYMQSIPSSLEESAKMDGANDITILVRIILPVCKPIIATIGLWVAVGHWNAWFDSMIYMTKADNQVVQLVMRRIVLEGSDMITQMIAGAANANDAIAPEGLKAATVMVTTIPILCVYPFIQKYFVKGVMIGSLKG